MNLIFNIDYCTKYGEQVVLLFLDGDKTIRHNMATADGKRWKCILDKCPVSHSSVRYLYAIERDGEEVRREWQTLPHQLELNAQGCDSYTVYDRWYDMPEDSYLYSSAFTDCLCQRDVQRVPQVAASPVVRIVVRAPQLRAGQRLAIVGRGVELGNWHTDKALPMVQHQWNEWVALLSANSLDNIIEFKFVALGPDDAALWETDNNHTMWLPRLTHGQLVGYDLGQVFFPICDLRVAGTLVPVFSLRSEKSFGVGDFGDLRLLTDFVAQTGQHVLQVLPVNDTTSTHTWKDSYPYSCISIFALHPQYVDLSQLPLRDKVQRERFEALRQDLNALPQIDYERVNNAKTEYLRLLYAQEGAEAMATEEYKRFFADNERWLVPYAQFCSLRDEYGTADFSLWPDHNTWNEDDRKALTNPRTKAYKRAAFWYYVQYLLDSQLQAAHRYARQKQVILKGDIPIGVDRHGCDVWMEPRYFNLNGQAGAPPDAFSVNGQNWGFPTYNWEEMLRDGCQWWVRRFRNMAKYFDAYRIDHVLGFFRIWEIPTEFIHGLMGQFAPAIAMTPDEIRSYGFNFQEERHATPFITDWVLQRVFGDRARDVRTRYFEPLPGNGGNVGPDSRYRFRAEYDTQRKLTAAFHEAHDGHSYADTAVYDGLMSLLNDVLFVHDRKDQAKFHPRITAQLDFAYESLYDIDKMAFNRLYDDYFYRRNNQFWYGEAMKKLPLLVQATRMLVCAEDLGMVPACVPWVMNNLRILSLEIQSMPKDPSVNFGLLERNPYRSVCTFSTHDMATLRQWWDEDPARTQDYYNSRLYRIGEAPHPLPGWLAREVVASQLASHSMLCVLSIQDWMAIDEQLRAQDPDSERINIPANPNHYWRYRMHVTIEDLMRDEEYVRSIKDLVRESGR